MDSLWALLDQIEKNEKGETEEYLMNKIKMDKVMKELLAKTCWIAEDIENRRYWEYWNRSRGDTTKPLDYHVRFGCRGCLYIISSREDYCICGVQKSVKVKDNWLIFKKYQKIKERWNLL